MVFRVSQFCIAFRTSCTCMTLILSLPPLSNSANNSFSSQFGQYILGDHRDVGVSSFYTMRGLFRGAIKISDGNYRCPCLEKFLQVNRSSVRKKSGRHEIHYDLYILMALWEGAAYLEHQSIRHTWAFWLYPIVWLIGSTIFRCGKHNWLFNKFLESFVYGR